MSYEDMRRAAAKGREDRVKSISGRSGGASDGQSYPGEIYTSDLRGTKGAPESGVAAGDTKGPTRKAGATKFADKSYVESELHRARGGKVEGKKGTTVNVIIAGAAGGGGAPMAPPMMARPPMPPGPGGMPPVGLGAAPAGPPPGAPMPGGAPMPPPMGHKRGGRVGCRADGGEIGVGVGGRSALGRMRKAMMGAKVNKS